MEKNVPWNRRRDLHTGSLKDTFSEADEFRLHHTKQNLLKLALTGNFMCEVWHVFTNDDFISLHHQHCYGMFIDRLLPKSIIFLFHIVYHIQLIQEDHTL